MDFNLLRQKIKEKQVSGCAIDSRLVRENEVFFALTGEKVDGHNFLYDVAQKKAAAAVVARHYEGPSFGLTLVRVDHVLSALQELAQSVFSERKTRVIGVTASVGKTTTKEFIATLLEGKFPVAKTPGTYNSQATFPLCVLNSSGDEEIYVMEMGMSLPGEISRLVQMAPPEIVFIGKLALSHAAFFPDGLEGIAKAKAEILSHPRTSLAIVHEETYSFAPFRQAQIQTVCYGGSSPYQLESFGEFSRVIERGAPSPHFTLPFAASHLRENFLGAVAIARSLGMSWDEIIPQIGKLKTIGRRFERVDRDGIVFINDSYNANPTSMRAAIENLPDASSGRKIGVLGEMRELGSFSVSSHREIGQLAREHFDQILCFGVECSPLVEAFAQSGKPSELFSDLSLLKKELFSLVRPGDVVLIKGSNSKCMWTLLE